VLDNLSPFAGLQSDQLDLLEVEQRDLLDLLDQPDLPEVDQLDLLDSERQEQRDLLDLLDQLDLLEVEQRDLLDLLDRLDLLEVEQRDQLDQQVQQVAVEDRPGRWEIPDQILLSMVVQELPSALLDLLEVSIG
jgi:hypothetical protein